MRKITRDRAVEMLLKEMVLPGDKTHIPQVFIVGNEICLTLFSALRYQRNTYYLEGCKLPIAIVTIDEAYHEKNGRRMPLSFDDTIDRSFDRIGEHFSHEDFYGWQKDLRTNGTAVNSLIFTIRKYTNL